MADTSRPNGFAIRRNGTCLAVEVDCGTTVNPYHACCPSGTACPSQYNVACCQSGQNCTESLVATPHCANSSWVMYNNGGYFCCDPDTFGFAGLSTGSDGCLLPLGAPIGNIQLLAIVPQTVISGISTIVSSIATSSSTPIVSSSSTTVTFPSTSTASPTSSNTSSPSTGKPESNSLEAGAIAGIVVGIILGIVILIFVGRLLYRRRKKKPPLTFSGHLGQDGKSQELYIHELGGVNRQEMPAPGFMAIPNQKYREYSELPAESVDHTIQH